jgi:hypothetical protein
MKPMFRLAAAMPRQSDDMIRREVTKSHVLHKYNEKKRPTGVSGLVRGGSFRTGENVIGETANGGEPL